MDNSEKQTIIEHLEELRKVIIVSVVAWFIASFFAYFAFREQFFSFLVEPLNELGVPLVQITITEAFFTKLKISLIAGLIIAMPIIIWQIFSFILPALTPQEKRLLYILFPMTVVAFVTGIVFCYLVVLRFAILFLIGSAGAGLTPMISVSKYISFLISFVLPFGFIFEMPLVSVFLTRLGIINHVMLASKRKYAVLMVVTIAAALTPGPDVVSQLLMAGPMLILYEISIIVSRIFAKKQKPELAESQEG